MQLLPLYMYIARYLHEVHERDAELWYIMSVRPSCQQMPFLKLPKRSPWNLALHREYTSTCRANFISVQLNDAMYDTKIETEFS
jgi:hypothetical protein